MSEPTVTPPRLPAAALLSGACLIYLFFALNLTGLGAAMFTDTDPLWHVAAGDLIREMHAIPRYDTWSYTAGEYRWLNISWAWDTAMSALKSALGWHVLLAVNAITIALIIATLFFHCLLRSGRAVPALLATFSAITLLSLSLRPLQISTLMAALWLLLLGAIARRELPTRWLAVFPLLTVLWVNMHGGFLMAPVFIGAFWLQARLFGDKILAPKLAFTLLTVLAALLCTPYGFHIFEAAWRPLTTVANQFIREWQPFTFSWKNLVAYFDLFIFIPLAFLPRLKLLPVERALPLIWCFLGLRANRHLSLFTIMAAPAIACAFASLGAYLPHLFPLKLSNTLKNAASDRTIASILLLLCIASVFWLPSPSAARHFAQDRIQPPAMREEISFMQTAAPGIRYLVHFNLASIVTYETQGKIPIFVDPRTETAFPPEILKEYLLFQTGAPGWEEVLRKYAINGVVLPLPGDDPQNNAILQRFHALPGWYEAFKGSTAIVFLRQ
jgi:hypothetical protein